MRLKSLQGINNGVLDDHHHNVAAEQYHNPFICSCCLYLQVSADVGVVWKYLLYNDRYEWGPKTQEYENDFVCDVNTNKNRIIYFLQTCNTFSLIHLIRQSYNDPQKILFDVLPYHTTIPNNFFFPWDMLYLQRINKDLQ